MRYLITSFFCFLLASPQVYACRGPNSWNHLFFKAVPNPEPDADLIAIVSVSDKKVQRGAGRVMAMTTVIQILKTSDTRVKQGDKIAMQYENTSCGPDPISDSKGMIIAKMVTNSKGHLVLHPYTHTSREDRITSPAILPDGFIMDPKPLRIGESIPQNSAVILIGVAGAESVDILGLDHSVRPSMSAWLQAHSNTIVAITIPVGIKQLSISQVTTGRRRAGYRPNDTVGVNTPKLDIDRPGLYYLATLDTNNPGQFQTLPLPKQLKQFRANYAGTVKRLEPINFKWPNK